MRPNSCVYVVCQLLCHPWLCAVSAALRHVCQVSCCASLQAMTSAAHCISCLLAQLPGWFSSPSSSTSSASKSASSRRLLLTYDTACRKQHKTATLTGAAMKLTCMHAMLAQKTVCVARVHVMAVACQQNQTRLLQLPGQQHCPQFPSRSPDSASLDSTLGHELAMGNKLSNVMHTTMTVSSQARASTLTQCKEGSLAWADCCMGCCGVNVWSHGGCNNGLRCCTCPSTVPCTMCTP